MRPLTLTIPKPLIPVAGRTMLDRALDHLRVQGVKSIVVNSHYLPECIASHLASQDDIVISHETEILETGGGVAKALPLLGTAPFFVVNSDIIWTDGATPALSRLADCWDDQAMDALLLLHPVKTATGYDGAGDFFLDDQGRPRRRGDAASAPYLFAGVQILHPRLFSVQDSGKFSLNILYDRALAQGRLAALVHDGCWYHVGTPEALPQVEALLWNRPG